MLDIIFWLKNYSKLLLGLHQNQSEKFDLILPFIDNWGKVLYNLYLLLSKGGQH